MKFRLAASRAFCAGNSARSQRPTYNTDVSCKVETGAPVTSCQLGSSSGAGNNTVPRAGYMLWSLLLPANGKVRIGSSPPRVVRFHLSGCPP